MNLPPSKPPTIDDLFIGDIEAVAQFAASIRNPPPIDLAALITEGRNEMVLAAERHSNVNVILFRRPAGK